MAASRTNETLCENSMHILKLLSEEIFDFSQGELTQVCMCVVVCVTYLSVLAGWVNVKRKACQ